MYYYPGIKVDILLKMYERLIKYELLSHEIEMALAKKLMDLLQPEHYLRFVSPGQGRGLIEEDSDFEKYVFATIASCAENIKTLLTAFCYTKPGSKTEEIFVQKIKEMARKDSVQVSEAYLQENCDTYSSFHNSRYKKLLEDLL